MAGPCNLYATTDITASPAGASETIIATLSGVETSFDQQAVKLSGYATITPQAAVVNCILKIRRGTVTGTQVGSSWTTGQTAAFAGGSVIQPGIEVIDVPGGLGNGIYVLTATMTTAGGASTVNAVSLMAFVN